MKASNNILISWKPREIKTHGLIDTFAKDCKHEDGCDRWSEIAGDWLDVVKELAALSWLYYGDPRYAHTNQGQDEHSARVKQTFRDSRVQTIKTVIVKDKLICVLPASNHELPLFGVGTDLSVDIHGEERTSTVKNGGKWAH